MTSPRVFFYVQHLLGIGHLKRAAAIARALVEAGAEVDFVLGGAPVAGIAPPGARVVQLPPAIASDAQFTNLLDEHGDKVDERWKVKRKQALLDAFEAAKPDIVLLEMYPFGRRQFRFELLPLLGPRGCAVPQAAWSRSRCATSWWTRAAWTARAKRPTSSTSTSTTCWCMAIPT